MTAAASWASFWMVQYLTSCISIHQGKSVTVSPYVAGWTLLIYSHLTFYSLKKVGLNVWNLCSAVLQGINYYEVRQAVPPTKLGSLVSPESFYETSSLRSKWQWAGKYLFGVYFCLSFFVLFYFILVENCYWQECLTSFTGKGEVAIFLYVCLFFKISITWARVCVYGMLK